VLPIWLHIDVVVPAWAYFVAVVVLDAVRQGVVAWLLREYVPSTRLDWINASLHAGGVLAYALIVYGRVPAAGLLWAWAWLARWLLFDLVLMLTWNYINRREHRPFEPLFKVGTAAFTDRATRRVAAWLKLRPELVRLCSWLLAVALSGLLGWFS